MTDAEHGEFTLVLGSRQLAFGLFMVVILMGTFTALAYIVGRMVLPVQAAAADHSAPEKVLVIDPATGERQVPAPPASRNAPARTAAPAPSPPASHFKDPQPGQLFLQVAAADRGVAEVFTEYLTRQSFPCQVATGPDERSYRVLVGPVRDNGHLATLRAGLEGSGFKPFLRRYGKTAP